MSADAIIKVSELHRSFDDVRAVRGLSFEISSGQVVGFIGANGAGKTTTMRMMATLDAPTAGKIEICGYNVHHFQGRVRGLLGWMPDSYGAYENVTVWEYLDFFARALGFRGRERAKRVAEVAEFTDLSPLAERYCNTLSKGMGQRLCLGRMLLHDPEVLILDEPAAGLDPKARVEFKSLVRILAEERKTIFLSSHILSELEDMCDSILFIDAGQIVHHGSTASLKQGGSSEVTVHVQVAEAVEALEEWVSLNPGVRMQERTKHGCRILVEDDDPQKLSACLKRMLGAGLPVVDFHREERKLEDAFMDMLARKEKKDDGAK
jgi:ABC-2 type transport system ATP-binding protein